MTAHQIAQSECANYCGGRCVGFRITDDLRTVAGRPLESCVLLERGKRCGYFETCVMPMVTNLEPPFRKTAFTNAIHRYLKDADIPDAGKRCETSGCRNIVGTRQRFCPNCAYKRKLSANRNSRSLKDENKANLTL